MLDLVIRNGTIVDGTGARRVTGDVGIEGGRLVQVGGTVAAEGREEIDATGLVVTPGFVDVHSHYDGQVTFDDELAPSSWHGVTTVIAGSCGIGFAPTRPEDRDRLVEVTEFVEDIPGEVLHTALPWDWESFPEYLDALDRRRWSIDVGTQIGHVALRTFVMGERGVANEPATAEDIATMAAVVREAIEAGALGFSTSRVLSHRTANGDVVPGTYAAEEELSGITAGVRAAGRGLLQVAQAGTDGLGAADAQLAELEMMRRVSIAHGLPVSYLILQSRAQPDVWREQLDRSLAARAQGAQLAPQVSNRPFGMLLGLTTRHPFAARPTFAALAARGLPTAELAADLADPAVRAAILTEDDLPGTQQSPAMLPAKRPQLVFPLGDDLDYEPTPDRSLRALAADRGVAPDELFYDLMLAGGGTALFLVPFFNYAHGNHDDIYDMLTHPASVLGLADGGAHLATICDASMPTYQLSHWVRGRTRGPRLDLESAVRMQTSETAALFGLHDRGVLAVGKKADLNVIDLDRVGLLPPHVKADLPAGGVRLLQGSVGYAATVVSGVVIRRNDADTGARPGRLVRGA